MTVLYLIIEFQLILDSIFANITIKLDGNRRKVIFN
jgi:hypothetical protein